MVRNETAKGSLAADSFNWKPQPVAGKIVKELVELFVGKIEFLQSLRRQLQQVTGTRLIDWIDHFELSTKLAEEFLPIDSLIDAGFAVIEKGTDRTVYKHAGGLFPVIVIADQSESRIGLKVESVVDFVATHQIQVDMKSIPNASKRIAMVAADQDFEFWVIEKHGIQCWETCIDEANHALQICQIQESFRLRNRHCKSNRDGFDNANESIDDAIERIGVDRACDLFFQCERIYWESRNHAARVQKARQDRLGLGWANHDHHTYRSSRESFADLISILEKLGFNCRERFYAGAEAGWGAQVLEQERCGIVVFADVDMSEEELAGDFAHEGFESRDELGTVGLWCALHGEAFLEAGMHHLECQFDYSAARNLLENNGVLSMDPFTDFAFLKQCFTNAEIWKVDEDRLETLVTQKSISKDEAEKFRVNGAVGSHLEILERNDGYKGFNQSGVSKIIAKTDPRKQETVID